MRINNNNNVTFCAYFKNNQTFKKIFSENYTKNIDTSLIDKFVSAPNHELEIINDGVEKFTSNSNYVLFNNTTGLSNNIRIEPEDIHNSLNIFLREGIQLCDERMAILYKSSVEFYEKLTRH